MPIANRAKQTTTTQTDALPYSLDASIPSGFISFVQGMSDISGDSVGPWPIHYVCEGASGQWEEGFGTLTDGTPDTVSRTTILRSSSGYGVAVNWGSGTRTIWIAPLAQDLYSLFVLLNAAPNGLINKTAARTVGIVTLGSAATALLDDNTAAAQRATLGSTTVGDAVFIAASASAARTALGATATGDAVFIASTVAAGRAALDSGTVGDAVFVADTGAVARAALGSTTVGDAVFIAATAAAARTALGLDGFTSSAQTITGGGSLTIPHGLGIKPQMVIVRLTCTSSEHGYTTGETLEYGAGVGTTSGGHGVAIVTNTTNILVRFGSDSNPFIVPKFSDGTDQELTSASWTVQFIALV